MSHRSLAPSSYRNLVAEILRIYDRTRQSLILGHWEIGKTIVEIEQDGASRAAYGKQILFQVSQDLTRERGPGFSLTNLKRFRRFYLAQKRPTSAQLGWSHHAELEVVHDAGQRRALKKRVVREGLSCHELRALIRAGQEKRGRVKPRVIDLTPLVPRKGPLGTHQIVSPEDVGWPDREVLLLDLGFRFYKALAGAKKRLKAGQIVEVRGKKIVKSAEKKPGYTYRAYLQKVIDGDSVPRNTAQEMRVGPSKPICGNGLQSTLSGFGQKPWS